MGKNIQGIETVFDLAVKGIGAIDHGEETLDSYLESLDFETQPRRAVASILFACYRHRAAIDELIGNHAKKIRPRIRRLLQVALTQGIFLDRLHPAAVVNAAVAMVKKRGRREAGFLNAVLRRCLEAGEKLPESTKSPLLNLPEVLREHFVDNLGSAEAERLAKLFLSHPPTTFRLCGDASVSELESVSAVEFVPAFEVGSSRFYICYDVPTLIKSRLLRENVAYIQNPSTATAPWMLYLKGDERVLDLCAAPGGKSLILAERLNDGGTLVAADRSAKRQEVTSENLSRFGYNCEVVVADAVKPPFAPESFDAVLLDVPCSNTGVMHRRPDAAWRFSDESLKSVVELQQDILESAAKLVKSGGQLVYSTCSIEPEENDRLIRGFIEKNPEFSLKKQCVILPDDICDGAGAALLKKR